MCSRLHLRDEFFFKLHVKTLVLSVFNNFFWWTFVSWINKKKLKRSLFCVWRSKHSNQCKYKMLILMPISFIIGKDSFLNPLYEKRIAP